MVCSTFSYDHMLQLKVENSDVRPSLTSPDGKNMMLQDDDARPQHAHITEEYKNLQNIAMFLWPSLTPDLNPIKHLWDELGRRVRNQEHAVSTVKATADLDYFGNMQK